jgi:hypothetical protein
MSSRTLWISSRLKHHCAIVLGQRLAMEKTMLMAVNVNALYPSIQLEHWMTALLLFMVQHTSFNQTFWILCLKLAHFVLSNNYVECKELGDTS